MKRKLNETVEPNKNRCLVELNDLSISASKVLNYFNDNTLVDWLNLYYENNKSIKKTQVRKFERFVDNEICSIDENNIINDFSNCSSNIVNNNLDMEHFLLNQGVKFEEVIITNIKNKINNENFHEIFRNSINNNYNKLYNDTIKLMEKGVPLIYQGFLYNNENNTYGFPDLIVRSDYVNKLIKYTKLPKNSCVFNKKWYYVIIDIKFTTLNFKTNNDYLLKKKFIEGYKGQLLIYNLALNKIQKSTNNITYILGRGYTQDDEKISNPFDKLGIIDYDTNDKLIVNKLNDALNWLRDLYINGNKWKIDPPNKIELYPNMKITDKWYNIKSKLANKNNEITNIWYCGVKHRNLAVSKGIKKWSNNKFNTNLINMHGKIIAPKLNNLLKINRSKKNNIYYDIKHTELIDWKNNNDNSIVIYLDFETYNNIHKLTNHKDSDGIYLIGNGYLINNVWNYKKFLVEDDSLESEYKMLKEWLLWLNSFNKNIIFYHYHIHEVIHFKKAIIKHNLTTKFLTIINKIKFIDLHKIIYNYNLCIKTCLNYSLKSIINSLSNLNYIPKIYDNNDCIKNGTEAMIAFYKSIEIYNEFNTPLCDISYMKDSIKYNEKDVLSLYHLLNFLKNTIK